MTIRCLNCGYRMSTREEIVRFLSELSLPNLPKIIDTVLRAPAGVVAQPMNAMQVTCPNCRTRGQWEDAPRY